MLKYLDNGYAVIFGALSLHMVVILNFSFLEVFFRSVPS